MTEKLVVVRLVKIPLVDVMFTNTASVEVTMVPEAVVKVSGPDKMPPVKSR